MDVKKRTFDETACEIAVYGGAYARFFVEGDSCEVPENAADTAREKGPRVAAERFPDGPAALYAQRLVPWDTEKPELAGLFEAQMAQFKKELGAKVIHAQGQHESRSEHINRRQYT